MQLDGRVNRSITNNLNDLDYFWEIEPINIKNNTNYVVVKYNHKGIYNLIMRLGYSILVLIYNTLI